jgi:hypothetical protein
LEKNNERTGTDLRRSDEMAILKNRQKERIKSSSEHEHQKDRRKETQQNLRLGEDMIFLVLAGPPFPRHTTRRRPYQDELLLNPLIDPTNKLGQET